MTPYVVEGLLRGLIVGDVALRQAFAALFIAAAALNLVVLLVYAVRPAGALSFLRLGAIGVTDVSTKDAQLVHYPRGPGARRGIGASGRRPRVGDHGRLADAPTIMHEP